MGDRPAEKAAEQKGAPWNQGGTAARGIQESGENPLRSGLYLKEGGMRDQSSRYAVFIQAGF